MGLKDCLISAVDQGEITREEASALADEFDTRFAQLKNGMSEDAAKAKARKDMEAAHAAEAKEKRRRADLTEAARLRTKGYLQRYRDRDGNADLFGAATALLSHYGFRGTSSVRGRTEAIIAGAQKNLDEVMFAFERQGLLGRRANRAIMSDFVKELHGEASGDATAKQLARAVDTVFEDLRQRFNAAGGAIGKIDKFGLPHSHDRLKVKRGGREAWKAKITPLLDPDRMTNPVTGQPVGRAGLDAALDHVYDSIVSQNRANITPSMTRRGQGSIASQRQDERFLMFRDAASWLDYNRTYGKGDVVQAVFNHVNGMARDIAAMEILGPNPAAMVEYMKQVVGFEIGKKEVGKPSLAKGPRFFKNSQAALAEHRLDALWQTMRGRATVAAGWADFAANLRNVLIAAQLGKTVILAASTDPFVARASRKLAGLPVTATISKMIATLGEQSKRDIIRSGIIWDEYMHIMHDELRFSGPAVGADWSRWIADRGVTWSGLQPLTIGRKLVEARAWQAHIADESGKAFAQLDQRFRTTLEGFGVDAATWDIWRKGKDPAGFVTPRQIELNGGDVQYLDMSGGALRSPAHKAEAKALAHRAAAEMLSEVISSWSERSVPAGTPNSRSILTGAAPRGTFTGEMVDYMLQYKSFGLSFTTMQMEAIFEMAATRGGGKGFRSGLAYMAPLAIMLTVGGAVYLQIGALLDGKKPEDMNDPGFWLKAAYTGGGFGLFGDFVKSSENRFGQSPFESLLGPGPAAIGDAVKLTLGNAQAIAAGEDTNIGRQTVQSLRRYTPVLSSHWATRGAYNRLVLDNLQWMLDPAADKSFKAQAAQAKKNGTPFFVRPGAFTP
jgi:hypothetical protein